MKKGGRHRWPRSFRRRQGKRTRAQKRAIRELWPRYGVDVPYGTVLDLDAVFGRSAFRVLEIGFGMGENLLARAEAEPHRDFVGVEVHMPGIGAVLKAVGERGLSNVRVIRCDVLRLLHDHLEGRCVDAVWMFFPEPWERPRDQPRRLARPLLREGLELRLARGGELCLATDIETYAAHVELVFAGWEGGRVERPTWRPVTKYEAKAEAEGRAVIDVRYRLTSGGE